MLEKVRQAKKNAEKQLAGATESDLSDSDQHSDSARRLNFANLTVSHISEDSSESIKTKKTEKKKRQKERRLANSRCESSQIS